MRRGRGSGLVIGEIGVEMSAGTYGNYWQTVEVAFDGFSKRTTVPEMVGKLWRAEIICL